MKIATMISLVHSRLKTWPYAVQLAAFFVLSYIWMMPILPFLLFLEHVGLDTTAGPKNITFFSVVIVAPLIETLIFQLLVFKLLSFLGIRRPVAVIFLSAALFGLGHCYNLPYMFWAFTQGLAFAIMYWFYLPDFTKAYWSTAFIHALRNATSLMVASALQL